MLARFAFDSAEPLNLVNLETQAWHFQILGANAFEYLLIDQGVRHIDFLSILRDSSFWLMIQMPSTLVFRSSRDLHLLLVPLCLIFRNPEFGHELGTTSAEGTASDRFGVVDAAIVGRSFSHRTSITVRATPPTRSRTTPEANVIDDPHTATKPNTTNHTGMIAVRLNSIDMVGHTSFLWLCG